MSPTDAGRVAQPTNAPDADFESLLTRISSMLVQVAPDRVIETIGQAAELLGRHMGVDRSFVAHFSPDKTEFRPTFVWTAEGLPEEDPSTSANMVEMVPWMTARMLDGKDLVAERPLDVLPPEAVNERAYVEMMGIQSTAIVPMVVGGEVVGNLGFDAIRAPRSWPEPLVARLRLVGEMFANALARRDAQLELEQRLAFEALTSRLSATFINLPAEQVDGRINDGLRLVGEFLDVDRVATIRLDKQPGPVRVTHMWRSPDVPADRGLRVDEIDVQFPWLVGEWVDQRVVSIEHLDQFPTAAAAERAYCEAEGLQSTLLVPVALEGDPTLVLGLDVVRAPRAWSNELIGRVRLLGEVFANALARRDSDRQFHAALEAIGELRDRLQAENVYLREEIEVGQAFDEIVGDSPALNEVLNRIRQVATTDTTVLVTGETGVGKEVMARAVHNQSARRGQALVKVNCGALPASLVESELFGHEKGAFTGATSKRVGRFELADGGTILLDEITELPLELQTRLLRVLQEGQFEPVGSSRTRTVDVRVIAAANRDVEAAVESGEFRSDLYYRLNVFPIHVPPLRDRRSDIPLLVWHLIAKHRRRLGKAIDAVPDSVMRALMEYEWPGNVRELENTIERAIIVTSGTELSLDVAEKGRLRIMGGPVDTPGPADETLDELQRAHIRRVLAAAEWKIKGRGNAAERLGISPSLLRHRMKKLGIERPARA